MKVLNESSFATPLVSFYVANRLGSSIDPSGKEGVVYHAAELATRGSGKRSREQFDAHIDRLGASLGFAIRKDYLLLRGGCLKRHAPELMALLRDTLRFPTFEKSEFDKLMRESERDLDDLRDADSSLAQRYFAKYCHPGHIYSRSALGSKESIATLEVEELATTYSQLYPSESMIVGIAGAMDQEESEVFGSSLALSGHPPNSQPSIPQPILVPPPLAPGPRLIVVDKPKRKQCQVLIGHLVPPSSDPDFEALLVASTAFGGIFSSRLMEEIRVKNGWSYGAYCSLPRARGRHAMQISMAPAQDVCPQAVKRAEEMFSELAASGLQPEELEFTRSYIIGGDAFARATPHQRLLRTMEEELFDLPKGHRDAFAKRVKTIKREQINAALKRHLRPDNLCTLIVGTANTLLPQIDTSRYASVEVVDFRDY